MGLILRSYSANSNSLNHTAISNVLFVNLSKGWTDIQIYLPFIFANVDHFLKVFLIVYLIVFIRAKVCDANNIPN